MERCAFCAIARAAGEKTPVCTAGVNFYALGPAQAPWWKGLLAVLRACLALMEQRLTEHKLAQARPEVVIRPTLPPDVGTLTGFGKAAEIIAAGEAAARAALPQIELLLPQQ